jgi:predicted transcriptional regulator
MARTLKEPVQPACVMLPPELRKKALQLAREEDLTLSQVIRASLRQYIAAHETRAKSA